MAVQPRVLLPLDGRDCEEAKSHPGTVDHFMREAVLSAPLKSAAQK
jgi:hypothetical protein